MASTVNNIKKGVCWKNFSNPDDINTYQALLTFGEVLKDRGRRQKSTEFNEFHAPKLEGLTSGLRELSTFTEDRCLYWATGQGFDAWVISNGSEHKLEELGLTIPEGIGEITYPTSRAIIVKGNRSMSFQGDGFRYASVGSHIIAPPTRFDFADGFKAHWSKPLRFQDRGIGNPEIVHTLAKHQYEQAGKYLPLNSLDQQRLFTWDRDGNAENKTRALTDFVNSQALGVTEDAKYFLQYMSFAVFLNSPENLKTIEDVHKAFIQITREHSVFQNIQPDEVISICSESFTRCIAYRLFTSNQSTENP